MSYFKLNCGFFKIYSYLYNIAQQRAPLLPLCQVILPLLPDPLLLFFSSEKSWPLRGYQTNKAKQVARRGTNPDVNDRQGKPIRGKWSRRVKRTPLPVLGVPQKLQSKQSQGIYRGPITDQYRLFEYHLNLCDSQCVLLSWFSEPCPPDVIYSSDAYSSSSYSSSGFAYPYARFDCGYLLLFSPDNFRL